MDFHVDKGAVFLKFSEYKYERPNMDECEAQFQNLLEAFRAAKNAEEQSQALEQITKLRNHLHTMMTLVEIRNSLNTKDKFYKDENDYFDQVKPRMQNMTTELYRALLDSPFQSELEEKWGKQFFALARLSVNTFTPEIMEDLQRENELISEYSDLLASAEIEFEGGTRNLAQMVPFETAPNRDMRRRASNAKWAFFEANSEQLDRIYDDLVQVRHRIAQKLGYKDFVDLAYDRMERTDYNRDMVKKFREQVRDYIVPVATKLRERQQKRIGVNTLRHYDDQFFFPTGNPAPKGDPDWIMKHGRDMYHELSPETGEFIDFMVHGELLDLLAKPGKAVGGYCTSIAEHKAPFIFANFNGTHGDIGVLTHEAGHAFQTYMSRNYPLLEYSFPTSEAAEIHSMSMEFFTWPWMDRFFEEDTEKFKFMHLGDALMFIPYGVAVDEFQHFVFENPKATPAERKAEWRRIEQTYLPHRNYEGNAFLESGGFWQKQIHIYQVPFYYIDYTLAQVCAFQFWTKMQEDYKGAWADYQRICKIGGSQSFLDIVKAGNLISPFEEGCVASVIDQIDAWLERVDDAQL